MKREIVIKYQARVNSSSEIIAEGNLPFEIICGLCSVTGKDYSNLVQSDMTIHRVTRETFRFQGEIVRVRETLSNPRKVSDYTEVFKLITLFNN